VVNVTLVALVTCAMAQTAPLPPVPIYETPGVSGPVWREVGGMHDRKYLYVDGRLVGEWVPGVKQYRAYVAIGQWAAPVNAPPHADKLPLSPCCGVDWKQVESYNRANADGSGNTYSINGVKVSRETAFNAIAQADGVPADRHTPMVICIGTEADCGRVKADFDAGPYRTQFLWQDYRPGDVMVAKILKDEHRSGSPAIFCQSGDGVDIGYAPAYAGPAALNAMLASSLRKINPDYKPSQPDGGSPVAGLDPTVLIVCGGMLAVALVMLATGRKRA
jgi:hypothetical protein